MNSSRIAIDVWDNGRYRSINVQQKTYCTHKCGALSWLCGGQCAAVVTCKWAHKWITRLMDSINHIIASLHKRNGRVMYTTNKSNKNKRLGHLAAWRSVVSAHSTQCCVTMQRSIYTRTHSAPAIGAIANVAPIGWKRARALLVSSHARIYWTETKKPSTNSCRL